MTFHPLAVAPTYTWASLCASWSCPVWKLVCLSACAWIECEGAALGKTSEEKLFSVCIILLHARRVFSLDFQNMAILRCWSNFLMQSMNLHLSNSAFNLSGMAIDPCAYCCILASLRPGMYGVFVLIRQKISFSLYTTSFISIPEDSLIRIVWNKKVSWGRKFILIVAIQSSKEVIVLLQIFKKWNKIIRV